MTYTLQSYSASSSYVSLVWARKEIVKALNGEGLRTIQGKPWNKSYVYYILKNEKYTGALVWNRQNSTC